jgi:hypothetical protein
VDWGKLTNTDKKMTRMKKLDNYMIDISGRWILLHRAKPITRWRRLKAKFGICEPLDMVGKQPFIESFLKRFENERSRTEK